MGHSWVGMVTAFQLLLIAGVGYAVINCIGEALAGGGSVRFRAKVNVAWSLCTLGVLIPLVQADGIRGAAFGQLGIFAAYALVYCTAGARRLDIRPAALLNALGPILLAVAVQATSTAGARVALGDAGMARAPASVAAALLGLTIMLLIGSHGRGSPVREARGALRLVSGQRTS
jgi:hypothetical protein